MKLSVVNPPRKENMTRLSDLYPDHALFVLDPDHALFVLEGDGEEAASTPLQRGGTVSPGDTNTRM